VISIPEKYLNFLCIACMELLCYLIYRLFFLRSSLVPFLEYKFLRLLYDHTFSIFTFCSCRFRLRGIPFLFLVITELLPFLRYNWLESNFSITFFLCYPGIYPFFFLVDRPPFSQYLTFGSCALHPVLAAVRYSLLRLQARCYSSFSPENVVLPSRLCHL